MPEVRAWNATLKAAWNTIRTKPRQVIAPRPDVVDALLGMRADLAAQVERDHARVHLWALYAAEGGLLVAELSGSRWRVVLTAVALAWRAGVTWGRWQAPKP